MAAPQFIRVKVKTTRTHITISEHAFDPQLHDRLKQEALDRNGNPRRPKYPSPSTSPGTTAEGEAALTATTDSEATKEAKP